MSDSVEPEVTEEEPTQPSLGGVPIVTAPPKPEVPEDTKKEPTPRRMSLDEYMRVYDPEKNPHPWIHYVKAVPMGGDRPAMNHGLEVLNMIAIHLERVGFVEPEAKNSEIKYVAPAAGPDVVWNPGTWVDIDSPEQGVVRTVGTLDFSGVPQEQLDILKEAIKQEEIRKLKLANADPTAQIATAATLPASNVEVAIHKSYATAPEPEPAVVEEPASEQTAEMPPAGGYMVSAPDPADHEGSNDIA